MKGLLDKLNAKRRIGVLKATKGLLKQTSKSKGALVDIVIAAGEFDHGLDCDEWYKKDPDKMKKMLNKMRKAVKLDPKEYTDEEAKQKVQDIIPLLSKFHGGDMKSTNMILGIPSNVMSDATFNNFKEEIK